MKSREDIKNIQGFNLFAWVTALSFTAAGITFQVLGMLINTGSK